MKPARMVRNLVAVKLELFTFGYLDCPAHGQSPRSSQYPAVFDLLAVEPAS
jgi:hypothetical protein